MLFGICMFLFFAYFIIGFIDHIINIYKFFTEGDGYKKDDEENIKKKLTE